MANAALITGASGGIGKALARLHAERGGDLLLVARSADRLEALKAELASAHGVRVEAFAADLSELESAQAVVDAAASMGLTIDVLINNAGFGDHGLFHTRDPGKQEAMIRLNVSALTRLTRLVLPGMVERGAGRVLNVASTAGMMPGPLQAVYYATKAYVLSFSQAVAEEVRGTGVTVTALCPGPVRTGFAAAGDLDGVKAWDRAATPESVAACGYRAMEKGRLVVVNDWKLAAMLRGVLPFLPRRTVLKISRRAMEKSD